MHLNTYAMGLSEYELIESYISGGVQLRPDVSTMLNEASLDQERDYLFDQAAFWYPRPCDYPDYGDIPDLEPVDDDDLDDATVAETVAR